jgi:hypothetical protein
MARVRLRTITALAAARAREIASVRGIEIIQPFLALGSVLALLEPLSYWFTFLPAQFGHMLAWAAMPAGRGILGFESRVPIRGDIMPALPASTAERILAILLLAAPVASPYLAAALFAMSFPARTSWAAAGVTAFVFGFCAQLTWTYVVRGRLYDAILRLASPLTRLRPARSSEVGAACWAIAPVALAMSLLLPALMTPLAHPMFSQGIDKRILALMFTGLGAVSLNIASVAQNMSALARLPVSRRSLALAALRAIVLIAPISVSLVTAAVHAFARDAATSLQAAQILGTASGFSALTAVVAVRLSGATLPVPLGVIVLLFPMVLFGMAITFLVWLNPALLPAIDALGVFALLLALLLAFTTSRDALSREPRGLVGAALRLLGAV